MGVTPGWGPRAAGEGAPLVPDPQRLHLFRRRQPHRPAEVEDLALGAEDDRDDRGVAGEPPDRLGGEELPGQRRAGAGALEQVLVGPSSRPRPPWPWPARTRPRRRRGGRPPPARPPGAGRWSGCPTRARVLGCGAASGPRIASSTAEPSGSSRSRYSAIPSSSYGWDKAVPCLSRSSRRWNSPRWPYFAISAGRSARIWRGPCRLGQRHEPGQHRVVALRGQPGPELVHLGDGDGGVGHRHPGREHRLGAAARCRAWRSPRSPAPAPPHRRRHRSAPTGAPTPPATPHPRPARPHGTDPRPVPRPAPPRPASAPGRADP